MSDCQLPPAGENSIGHRTIDADDFGQVVPAKAVFIENVAQHVEAADLGALRQCVGFVMLDQTREDLEVIVLVAVQGMPGQRADDLDGVVVTRLVVDRTRRMPFDEASEGRRQPVKSQFSPGLHLFSTNLAAIHLASKETGAISHWSSLAPFGAAEFAAETRFLSFGTT